MCTSGNLGSSKGPLVPPEAAQDPGPGLVPSSHASPRPVARRRYGLLRRAAFILFVLGGLYLFHVPLLRVFAGWLVVDEPERSDRVVCLLGGDRCIDRAAEFHRSGLASEFILLEPPPNRTTQLGVTKSPVVLAKRELQFHGITPREILVLKAETGSEWSQARALRSWLEHHPDDHLTVLCDQFATRKTSHVFASVLGTEMATRLHWRALPDRRYNPTNWWRQKAGVLAFSDAYVRLAHVYLFGEDARAGATWDPGEYEASLCGD
jgi:hypothetical protein